MPKVLIADELSPRALEIFRERGVEVDVNTGLKKPDLLKIIAQLRWTRGALRDQGRQGCDRRGHAAEGDRAAPASVSTTSTFPRPRRAVSS